MLGLQNGAGLSVCAATKRLGVQSGPDRGTQLAAAGGATPRGTVCGLPGGLSSTASQVKPADREPAFWPAFKKKFFFHVCLAPGP